MQCLVVKEAKSNEPGLQINDFTFQKNLLVY
jgi:hypothetical protein